jgi:hypothetical protein
MIHLATDTVWLVGAKFVFQAKQFVLAVSQQLGAATVRIIYDEVTRPAKSV